MELALTFGAVGDFIAVSILIKDIILSLDDCRGSSKAYQDLIQSLVILDAALCEVDQVFRDPRRATIAQRLCATALDSLRQIKDALQSFHDKLKKFRLSLVPGGSGNRFKDAAKKIQFKMDEKDINAIKGEIRAYTMGLSILIQVMTLHTLDRHHDEISKRLDGVGTEAQSTRKELESTSRTLVTFFQEIGHQVLGKIAFLTQTTLEIKTSAMQIASTVLSLSLELSSFRLLLLSFGRSPDEEFFTLEDALGRNLPIHLRTITSWEALAFVLSEAFKGKPGARRVEKKKYRLLDRATQREIAQNRDWTRSFSRYQRIDMSLLCEVSEFCAADSTTVQAATCPRCKEDSDYDTSTQIQCRQCNMFFTRVVEMDGIVLKPPKRRRPRETDDDYESDEAEVHGLVRVTMITRRKRIKVSHVTDSGRISVIDHPKAAAEAAKVAEQPQNGEWDAWHDHQMALQSLTQGYGGPDDPQTLQYIQDAQDHLTAMGNISQELVVDSTGGIIHAPYRPRAVWDLTARALKRTRGKDSISARRT